MQIVIVGNGVAGISTARHLRKGSDWQIRVISSESAFHYSRPALMYLYMGQMRFEETKPYEDAFWEKNRIDLVFDRAIAIDTVAKLLHLDQGSAVYYDKLVLATGAKPNFFGWPGQHLQGVQGLYGLQDLQRLEQNTRNIRSAVLVGGGLIGIELAEMLRSRGIDVTMLIRESNYWGNILRPEEAELVAEEAAHHGVKLKFNTQLEAILGDGQQRVKAVKTNNEELACQFVGLTAGVHPNLDLAKSAGIPCNRGILVNEYFETKISDIYAAGDCAELCGTAAQGRVEQLWYTGKAHGEVLAANLLGQRQAYQRGILFNSAKFFDIEYQTYGHLPAQPDLDEASLFWRNDKKCVRLSYRQSDGLFLGMNSFGIRYRHLVIERWLSEARDIRHVLTHLGDANFDPEFFRRFEAEIVARYNAQNPGEKIQLAKPNPFAYMAQKIGQPLRRSS